MDDLKQLPVLKKHLYLSYEKLEKMNLEAKKKAFEARFDPESLRDHYLEYLKEENKIKAVTLCFSDLEGRLHMLDYDKKYLIRSHQNLTFDGSSVKGFSRVSQSDLFIRPDWGSFRWLPGDIFGSGKVIMFGRILDRDGSFYEADLRSKLAGFANDLEKSKGIRANVSVECEGVFFKGTNAEQKYYEHQSFELTSTGGYFNSLPKETLRRFIDEFADAQRCLGFENEKDHPEVAPSQFELNFSYCSVVLSADQLQLYKLLARQIAHNMGMTACFLPKPIANINGNGLHTNISLEKEGKNIFYGGSYGKISESAVDFINRILYSAEDLSLILSPSVNAYRRIDPEYEAPDQIKYSSVDRTSMIRIPAGNEQSSRIEVRTVSPDANPYLAFYSLLSAGLSGPLGEGRKQGRRLPQDIYRAMDHFKDSHLVNDLLGEETAGKYLGLKEASANRSPRELGGRIKPSEVVFHHEVTNQYLWSLF